MEKLEVALRYGADAVYLGGKLFSLRNLSGNFSLPKIRDAVSMAHDVGARLYVTCNVYPRTPELPALSDYIESLCECAPDALIVSDPGVVAMVRDMAPEMPLHLSTQANTTNAASARFWAPFGVTRINAARELPLPEIEALCSETGMEVECFVHGAMCISYSGRCLLSSYLAGRDGNRGHCAHPCRWRYAVMEETRPGQFLPIEEDNRGAYIFNSKDLCLIDHLPHLIRAGVHSLKIEGRMKGIHYLAVVVGAYREALDRYFANPSYSTINPALRQRLETLSHRGYGTGFYFSEETAVQPNRTGDSSENQALFIGKVLEDGQDGTHLFHGRNKFAAGVAVEVLIPGKGVVTDEVLAIETPEGSPLSFAQPNARVRLSLQGTYPSLALLRIPAEN